MHGQGAEPSYTQQRDEERREGGKEGKKRAEGGIEKQRTLV